MLVIAVDSYPLPLWGCRTSPDHLELEAGVRVPGSESAWRPESEPLAAAAADVQRRLLYRPGWGASVPHTPTSVSTVVGHKLWASLAFAWSLGDFREGTSSISTFCVWCS